MLPPLLCEELCSLNPGVDRLAYSCVWKMNRDGTMVDEPAWFGRTVIRSCAKLDYTTAQHMIEGTIRPGDPSSITPDLWDLHRRARRSSNRLLFLSILRRCGTCRLYNISRNFRSGPKCGMRMPISPYAGVCCNSVHACLLTLVMAGVWVLVAQTTLRIHV